MKLSNLARRMIITILVIGLVGVLGSVIYYRSLGFLPFLFGVLLGSAVSIAKVFLLERAVDKALELEGQHAKNYVSLQHILRLFLTGVVIFIGAVVDQVSLLGVALGVFAFQLATYNIKFTLKSESGKGGE